MTVRTIAPPPEVAKAVRFVEPAPLNNGDRLPRAEFERRYHAHPNIKKAELVEERLHDKQVSQ